MDLRTPGIVAAVCAALNAIGCASPQTADPTNARAAIYSTDYRQLIQEVTLEVKSHYPRLAVRPEESALKTGWHQLPLTETNHGKEDVVRYKGSGKGDPNDNFDQRRAFRRDNTKREMKQFVRFVVKIIPAGAPGGSAWKVVVIGEASEFDGTGVPVVLNGAARPYWLDGRIAKLEVEIHQRVKSMAAASR